MLPEPYRLLRFARNDGLNRFARNDGLNRRRPNDRFPELSLRGTQCRGNPLIRRVVPEPYRLLRFARNDGLNRCRPNDRFPELSLRGTGCRGRKTRHCEARSAVAIPQFED